MPQPTAQPLQKSFQFQSLKKDQINQINDASQEILERTGVRFFHPQAIELFQKGGAAVEDGSLVKIPPRLVEWALKTAPQKVSIYDQVGKEAMVLGGDQIYFGTGSDCLSIYDLDTKNRRKATLEDVKNGVRLVDALPHLDFVMSMFLPSDVPEDTYERYQLKVMLEESNKPLVYVGLEGASTTHAVEMASVVSGGLESLMKRPFLINYVNTVSSFHHNEESIQRLLYAAERNLPTIYAPGNMAGMTAPITAAGMLALGNAGQLAGLVLSQLQREGSPFIRSNPSGGCLDMRSMVNLYTAPDCGPIGWDIAQEQGLPIFGTAGCSDAKVFDAQAAAESAMSLMTNVLGGAHLIHDIGYLDNAMTGSLELVAFCSEVISWLKCFYQDPAINQETLALDLIHEVGPDGVFLESEHTYRHVFAGWKPNLFDRNSFAQWMEDGGLTLQQRANQEVKSILREHQPAPLAEDIKSQLQALITKS